VSVLLMHFTCFLQQISQDCTVSESQDSFMMSRQAHTYKLDSMLVSRGQTSVPCAGTVVCSHEAIARTVNAGSLNSLYGRLSFSSRPNLSLVDSSIRPHSLAGPTVSLSSPVDIRQSHGALSQNTLLPAYLTTATVSGIAGSVQAGHPPNFAMPSSSVFAAHLQPLPTRPSIADETQMVVQRSFYKDHPSSAINRLREKIGRGWLPPEPPYPPPPDDTPPPYSIPSAESRTATVGSVEQNKTSVNALPVADANESYRESEFYAEPPLVDSTTEVTTTTDCVDSDAGRLDSETVTHAAKRPIEREDGEISDDEPDSVGADLPPDSSGISSSNSHWYQQSRPPSFRGFRSGGMIMTYRPRFPFRGRFPRGRGFFRGRGFGPWRQWYDQQPVRDWVSPDDEHVVDSSGVLSPQMETIRKHSASARSHVHSPISSSDSEREDSSRHARSDRRSSKSDRRSRHKSKSKHDDHPVADSTRTSVASPEFQPSSDSDKEPASHSAASKKKVCASACVPFRRDFLLVV